MRLTEEPTAQEYRVKVSIRNNLLLSAIEATGCKSVAQFCRDNEMHEGKLNALLCMRVRPVTVHGEFSTDAKKLMEILGATPSDLWTPEQLALRLPRNSAERNVGHEEVQALLQQHQNESLQLPSPEENYANQERAEIVAKAMEKLKPQQQKVLALRFTEDMTLEQTAQRIGVTRERARQIEARALRDLRHPKISKTLKEFL